MVGMLIEEAKLAGQQARVRPGVSHDESITAELAGDKDVCGGT
jgi:hypothetical protein